MIFRQRPNAPNWLTTKYKKWGKRYAAKRKNSTKKNDFIWATYKSQKVNVLLKPILKQMTQNHCAFCDGYPLEQLGPTVEHFRPKAIYPLLSYAWINLFYSCRNCQEKGDKFDRKLLKPDQIGYDFGDYFTINYRTYEISPNPQRSKEDQARAKITVELYGLNDFGRPEDRERSFRQFYDANNPVLDEFPYRFLFL